MLRHFFTSILLTAAALSAQSQVCTITAAGNGCGANLVVTLEPLDSPNSRVQLDATGLHPHTHGAMHWGLNPVGLPIFTGSSCLLHTDYIWGRTFMTDAQGAWTWGRAWPWAYQGYFYMQVGTLKIWPNGDYEVLLTNCELVACSLL